jgi:hypothetical protein
MKAEISGLHNRIDHLEQAFNEKNEENRALNRLLNEKNNLIDELQERLNDLQAEQARAIEEAKIELQNRLRREFVKLVEKSLIL